MGGKYYKICDVESQSQIAGDIFSMWLNAGEIGKEARPGQFVSLYTSDASKLLPRPISLCEISPAEGKIRLVYRAGREGTGTRQFAALGRGSRVTVLGPLGNGFPLDRCQGKRTVLIGGGVGIPPLLAAAAFLKQESSEKTGTQIQAVLGYKDSTFLEEEFHRYGEVLISSESGTAGIRGTVLDALEHGAVVPDIILSCGPLPMLRAVKEYAAARSIECWVSLEERMACGIGACLGCVCKSTEVDGHSMVRNKRVCTEGPVFPAESVVL